MAPRRALASPRGRKVVVVTFGGGARDDETFMPDGQENIPHLLHELMPRATFFANGQSGILGHYVATASIATGVYETFNNFAAVPPNNPTVFEYFRKDLKRPATDAWVVAPSNGFARIGESGNRLTARAGRRRDSAKAPAGGGALVVGRWRRVRASAAGQLRDASLCASNSPATRSNWTRWRRC